MPICPECDTDLDLDEEELEEGEIVSCRNAVRTLKSLPKARWN